MPRRVLVVDDDRNIRSFVSQALADEGYDVLDAPDGQAALDRVRAQPPDVILLDYGMPVCDGKQFVSRYRRLPPPHAPIVLMTAATRAQERCIELAAEGCLAKPFDLDDLLTLVGQFLA
jgi:CheY-like chemotaxis protein